MRNAIAVIVSRRWFRRASIVRTASSRIECGQINGEPEHGLAPWHAFASRVARVHGNHLDIGRSATRSAVDEQPPSHTSRIWCRMLSPRQVVMARRGVAATATEMILASA